MVFQRYIILLASVFYMGIVRAVFVFIAQNARRNKVALSEDIAAILLCTALYMHPKNSCALYVQYKKVSSMFSTLYYTFSKCNLHGYSWFSMLFHCWKSALKEEKKVRRVFYPKIT